MIGHVPRTSTDDEEGTKEDKKRRHESPKEPYGNVGALVFCDHRNLSDTLVMFRKLTMN